MDLWVVAAATGAGYLAKYWNRISKDGDGARGLSSEDSNLENPESPSCPFPFPKQGRRDELGKDASFDRRALEANSPKGLVSTVEVASSRGLDDGEVSWIRNYNENNVLSVLNLPSSFSPSDSFMDNEDGNEQSSYIVGDRGFLVPVSCDEVVCAHGSSWNKASLRSRHSSRHVSRPLNSLESCFMAQLYTEHARMEECVFGSLSSPSVATRPFLVSDGSRIISRANDNSFSPLVGRKQYKLHKAVCHVKDESAFGFPSLPEAGSSIDAIVMKFNEDMGRSRRLSSSNNVFREKHIHAQCDAMFLFSLGISFGMLTSIMASKREMDELRGLLKHTGNLIQDLHEELDMKDSMTVKELHNENYGSQGTCDHSFYEKEPSNFSHEKHMDNSPRFDCEESYDQREEHSLGSMSKIEAELEAELERLGLDMNASSLERKLSELVELDPEFVADFAQGEFRADLASANHAVSPHELSLRLHEVAQSQLKERVRELEIAFENSQRKVRLLESELKGSSQKPSSFTGGDMLTCEECDPMAQPLILNLSGEALGAYNEAYEELIKIDDSEENSPLGIIHDDDHEEGSTSHDWHELEVQHGDVNGGKLSSSEVAMLAGQCSSVYDLNVSFDESCSNDNEVEKQLIRQIIERTKRGSPVLQNAKGMLYSMDEDEH